MTRRLAFESEGCEDYLSWQTQDRKTLRRINILVADILRGDPFEGIDKPEPLQHVLAGAWSRRIDDVNRLVYFVSEPHIVILQARDHYCAILKGDGSILKHFDGGSYKPLSSMIHA